MSVAANAQDASAFAAYEADPPYNNVGAPPNPKFLGNCCSKGYRAFAPYTSNWPYNAVFPPNDRRMDEWQTCTDPSCYSRRKLACYLDDVNWACVDTAPHSSTFQYWRYLQRRERGTDWTQLPPQARSAPSLHGPLPFLPADALPRGGPNPVKLPQPCGRECGWMRCGRNYPPTDVNAPYVSEGLPMPSKSGR